VQRKTTFLAEGLREYALLWAKYTLIKWGASDEDLDVCVSLIPQEELTKQRQVETMLQIADMVAKFATANPALIGFLDVIIDGIPGLTAEQRAKMKAIVANAVEMGMQERMMEQMPENAEGALPEASEEYQTSEMPEPPMPEEVYAPMGGAGEEPLPNAPAITY
jgi:hypothetical protein